MPKTLAESRDLMSETKASVYQTLAHRHVHAGAPESEKYRRMCVLAGIQIAYRDAIEGDVVKTAAEIADEFYCLSRDMQFTPAGWAILDRLYESSLK